MMLVWGALFVALVLMCVAIVSGALAWTDRKKRSRYVKIAALAGGLAIPTIVLGALLRRGRGSSAFGAEFANAYLEPMGEDTFLASISK